MCSIGRTAQLLLAKQFLKNLNWAKGIDAKGRPILNDLKDDANGETYVCPGFQGGTNWFSTSFNPGDRPLLLPGAGALQSVHEAQHGMAGRQEFMGGAARPAPGETFTKSLRAINIQTGDVAWDLVAGQRTGHRVGRRDLDGVRPGVLRREQRIVHGRRRGERQGALGVPDQPGVEGVADDLRVRQQAVHRDRGRAEHHRVRAAGLKAGRGWG